MITLAAGDGHTAGDGYTERLLTTPHAPSQWMRLRAAMGGDIGVFEDLQTLVVVLAGIAILLTSTMFNWSALSSTEHEQQLYDEAESIIDQIESWERLKAVNHYGSAYPDFMLRQPELVTLRDYGGFEERVRSDLKYNVKFDDLVISDENESASISAHNEWLLLKEQIEQGEINDTQLPPEPPINYSKFEFGEPVPEDKDTIIARVHYALVMEDRTKGTPYDVSKRHPCLMTVVVWR
jgi:hypothetical protein